MTVKPAQRLQGFSLSKNSKFVVYSRLSTKHTAAAGAWVSTDKLDAGSAYYRDADVAALLGISVGALRNKISAGDPLPPRLQPDGFRKRLWPCEACHAWLGQFEGAEGSHQRIGFLRRA